MYEIGYDDDDLDDILGEGDYLVGDDYLVGRMGARRRGRRGGRASRRAVARKRAKAAALVSVEPPTQSRHLVLGFDSGAAGIAAAAAANVTANPQKVFRPERISVNSAIASNFLLNTLLIGTNNQLLGAAGASCDTFSSLSVATTMKMDTAQINSTITMNVTNLSLATLRFLASLIGTSVS